ncbi:hypothetical protein [Sphingomonas turrisvirgatae]|uniref:Lipoprotein n=1 Tax=Sphingomonas turrisvirgatae TaxID=1888892 RepID=A0A1E3M0X9_9SPHN|nr:hypothetical protein [Sphingomonas turrisvirgatae]ODP39642.1 hypothetical protein BFL28_08360 [Sphingomonas turrisvirgatae]
MRHYLLTPALLLAACGSPDPAPQPSATPTLSSEVATPTSTVAATPAPAASSSTRFVAADLVRQQWGKAENRETCAPVAFTDVGGADGTPRAATFSGGWAVAFDLPDRRSAYGVAGPGLVQADRGPPYAKSRELAEQWPYRMELDQLERPSFAGYGLEGAKPYHAANSTGQGENSLAYVRIHRQQCTYNVWSRLGRAHLETLLRGLQLLPRQN